MTNIETVSIVIAAVSVVIGVINSIRSNQKAEEQRQMELFTQLYNNIVTEQFARNFLQVLTNEFKDYEDWLEQLGNPELAISSKLGSIHRLIVYLCVAINKRLIDIDLVDDLIATPIIMYWEKVETFTKERRIRIQDYTLGYDIETAYKTLKQRRELEIAQALQQVKVNT